MSASKELYGEIMHPEEENIEAEEFESLCLTELDKSINTKEDGND